MPSEMRKRAEEFWREWAQEFNELISGNVSDQVWNAETERVAKRNADGIDALTGLLESIAEQARREGYEQAKEEAAYLLREDPNNVGTWAVCCRRNADSMIEEIQALQPKEVRRG